MLSYITDALTTIEVDKSIRSRGDAFARLRSLGLDDFGEILMQMPHPSFPRVSAMLPAMASDAVQDSWTGGHGHVLLQQTSSFVRSLACNYTRTGRTLSDARILDYGCGWGRISRLLYYFTNEVYGIDPWDRSIEECRKAGLGDRFRQSDYLPQQLPIDGLFDCVVAFSVFTHLSERAAISALRAIRAVTAPGGLLALTIRPLEYWDVALTSIGPAAAAQAPALKVAHARTGFAFLPHDRAPVDGDITYGDASMTLDWLAHSAVGWTRLGIDRSIIDPLQLLVFLQA